MYGITVEKGKPEVKKIHTVMAVFTFTDEDLADDIPMAITKKQLFELMADNGVAESEDDEVNDLGEGLEAAAEEAPSYGRG